MGRFVRMEDSHSSAASMHPKHRACSVTPKDGGLMTCSWGSSTEPNTADLLVLVMVSSCSDPYELGMTGIHEVNRRILLYQTVVDVDSC